MTKTIELAYCRRNQKGTELYGVTPEGKRIHLKNIRILKLNITGNIRNGSISPSNTIVEYEDATPETTDT